MEKYVWSFVLLVSLCVSMLLLIKVTKTLPVGTAYAIWTGIGAAGTVFSSLKNLQVWDGCSLSSH